MTRPKRIQKSIDAGARQEKGGLSIEESGRKVSPALRESAKAQSPCNCFVVQAGRGMI